MLTLTKKLRRESQQIVGENNNNNNISSAAAVNNNNNNHNGSKKVSIRDRLLVKELQDLPSLLPPSTKINFPDPDKLYEFRLVVAPEEGHWSGGKFTFSVSVTEEYNFAPPLVRCLTRLFHPNITEDGAVCLSLLRQSSIDELGWAPTRTLKDVCWGVESLFTDLLNFDDPLNPSASEQFQKDPSKFSKIVKEYIQKYCQ